MFMIRKVFKNSQAFLAAIFSLLEQFPVAPGQVSPRSSRTTEGRTPRPVSLLSCCPNGASCPVQPSLRAACFVIKCLGSHRMRTVLSGLSSCLQV